MTNIRSVCVYCGSGNGIDPAYVATAEALGRAFAERGIRLVYGGGSIGLMGTVARGALSNGGKVTGIIPQFLRDREVMLLEVDELIVTGDMHERKRLMFERADAFVALPGGIGTLEEVVEMMTWAQLGRHAKPIVLVNVNDFWSPLVHLIEHMRAQAFIRPGLDIHFDMVPDAAAAIDLLTRHVAAGDDGETAVLDRL
ncbi:LOG family protein [Segnochrobactrum spirostomi]|uniref:Cytokinin riboside 5'-monophosphate phosphoribohydrolase n=1 Tax=Segnochrobactrum spirostomi TaxID=2608987 RepID=A0A6A7Y8Y2_9HYPH|nr:TIGR00730 family Rossman fold protein [Segnochrobactrum spirostomi]MQT14102.1 TIGR00730 family Rossman fold protein [Segnochrobactrum spirostomi]